MKLNSRSRPDSNISQTVQLKLLLFKKYKNEAEGNEWFAQFYKKYNRFHNLRNSLKSIGIEMA